MNTTRDFGGYRRLTMTLVLSGSALSSGVQAQVSARTQIEFSSVDGTRAVQVDLRPEGVNGDRLSLELGFRSAEFPSAGELHDSLAVTLYRVEAPGSTTLAVSDVFGFLALPTSPGSLAIPAGALTITSVLPRMDAVPGETMAIAYEIQVNLPAVYRDRSLGLSISFFDNGDGLGSVGYARALVVPEMGTIGLLGVGLALVGVAWRGGMGTRGARPSGGEGDICS